MKENHMEAIRERSGNVTIDCKLTSFLYTLIRDYVQPGDIENIMIRHISDESVVYSNGWLAKYARDVAERLLSKPQLKDADWCLDSSEMKT